MDRFVVRKRNLKYRMKDVNEGKSFTPNVGSVIVLSDEVAKIEIKSGNVRRLLPEEKEKAILKKEKKKKKIKAKDE